ncbi:hypothetical protein D3C77_761410 [compost metagenome]
MSRTFDHVTKAGKGFGSQGLSAKAVEDRGAAGGGRGCQDSGHKRSLFDLV